MWKAGVIELTSVGLTVLMDIDYQSGYTALYQHNLDSVKSGTS